MPEIGVDKGKRYFKKLPGEEDEVLRAKAKQANWAWSNWLESGENERAISALTQSGFSMPQNLAAELVDAFVKKGTFRVQFDCIWDPTDPAQPNIRRRHYENFRSG